MDLLQTFLDKRPEVRRAYRSGESLAGYLEGFAPQDALSPSEPACTIVVKRAHALLPETVDPTRLTGQLCQVPLVSSADHAGVLHFGILYNANLMYGAWLAARRLPYQLVFASTRVPLNNASHPRGVSLAGTKHNFFSKEYQRIPICLLSEGIGKPGITGLADLFRPDSLKNLDGEQRKFLEALFLEALDLPGLCREGGRFDQQSARINARLWPHYFAAAQRSLMPALLHVPTEQVVHDLVMAGLQDPASLIWQVCFDPEFRAVYRAEFSGVTGAWDDHGGTHFFWAVDGHRRLVALRLNPAGDRLQALDPAADVADLSFRAESVMAALSQGRLVPSLFVEMLVNAFGGAFTLLGGFNQVQYLSEMKAAHVRCLQRLGEPDLAERFARVRTDGLICGPMPFPQWSSGLDLIWHHNSTNGRFNGNLDGGLSPADIDTMMASPMKTLIENGVLAMMDVVE